MKLSIVFVIILGSFVARGEDKSEKYQQRYLDCQIIFSDGKKAEASHLEVYGCDKNGMVQLVTWSDELDPIKILFSGQCTLLGKNITEDLTIETNFQGESMLIKIKPSEIDKHKRRGTVDAPNKNKKITGTVYCKAY